MGVLFRNQTGTSIEWNGTVYNLLQFHFHAPSENTINGNFFDLEAHLVHRSPHGESLVLAHFFNVGSQPNSYMREFWNDFPSQIGIRPEKVAIESPYNLLLPNMWQAYYTWMGSLTTPPCTSGLV